MTDAVDPALAAALDELGAANLDDFVATRDRVARALKADGKGDAAAALRARRRPSVVAWSVNQVARDRGDLVDALYAAADDVRTAIERGDGDALRTAMRAQRSRTAELTDLAVDRVASVSPNPAAHRESIARTWEAAAADDALRGAVSSATLSSELQPGGTVSGTPSMSSDAAPPKKATRRAAPAAPGCAARAGGSRASRPRRQLARRCVASPGRAGGAASRGVTGRRAARARRCDRGSRGGRRRPRAATRSGDTRGRGARRARSAGSLGRSKHSTSGRHGDTRSGLHVPESRRSHALRVGRRRPDDGRVPRRRVGRARARRPPPLRAPHPRRCAGRAQLDDDPAQARRLPAGVRRASTRRPSQPSGRPTSNASCSTPASCATAARSSRPSRTLPA